MHNFKQFILNDWSGGIDGEQGKFTKPDNVATSIVNFQPKRNPDEYSLKLRNGVKFTAGYSTNYYLRSGGFEDSSGVSNTRPLVSDFMYSKKSFNTGLYEYENIDIGFTFGTEYIHSNGYSSYGGIGIFGIKNGTLLTTSNKHVQNAFTISSGSSSGCAPTDWEIIGNYLVGFPTADSIRRDIGAKKLFYAKTSDVFDVISSGLYLHIKEDNKIVERDDPISLPAIPHSHTVHRGRLFFAEEFGKTVYYCGVDDSDIGNNFDSYTTSSPNNFWTLSSGGSSSGTHYKSIGQSFWGTSSITKNKLSTVHFLLGTKGKLSGNLYARIYSSSGNYPKALLATSKAVDASTIPRSEYYPDSARPQIMTWTSFSFEYPNTIALSSGTKYWAVLDATQTGKESYSYSLQAGGTQSSGNHSGDCRGSNSSGFAPGYTNTLPTDLAFKVYVDADSPRFRNWSGTSEIADGGSLQVSRDDSYITALYSTEAGLLVFCNNATYLWSYPNDTGPSDVLNGSSIVKISDIGCCYRKAITTDGSNIYILRREPGVGISLYMIDQNFVFNRITGNGYQALRDLDDFPALGHSDNCIYIMNKNITGNPLTGYSYDNTKVYRYSVIDNAFFEVNLTECYPEYILNSDSSEYSFLVSSYLIGAAYNPTPVTNIYKLSNSWSDNTDLYVSYGDIRLLIDAVTGEIDYEYLDLGAPSHDKYLRQIIVGSGPYQELTLTLTVDDSDGDHDDSKVYAATNKTTEGTTSFDIGERVRNLGLKLELVSSTSATMDTGIDFIEFRYRDRKL